MQNLLWFSIQTDENKENVRGAFRYGHATWNAYQYINRKRNPIFYKVLTDR